MISLDANILIYAAQTVADRRKASAIDCVARAALCDAVLPVQALGEFANACRNKGLLDGAGIARQVGEMADSFRTFGATAADVIAALSLMTRYSLSTYDALICSTSSRAGATTLLTEDMQDGASYDGLRILNPFNPDNASLLEGLLTPSS